MNRRLLFPFLCRSGVAAFVFLAVFIAPAWAHEVRPAMLEIRELASETYRVTWKVPAAGSRSLNIQPRFDERCQVTGAPTDSATGDAWVRSWTLDCDGTLAGTTIQIEGLNETQTDVFVRFHLGNGRSHHALISPSAGGFQVPHEASSPSTAGYLKFGTEHILAGWDHLLFVLGLTLLVRGAGRLLGAITGFTLGHSVTLALAALGGVHLPQRPVEAIIALSILMLGVELRRVRAGAPPSLAVRYPWAVSSVVGLLHGLGFAGALAEIGLPEGSRLAALVLFNVGVELGQVMFVVVIVIGLSAVRQIRQEGDGLLRVAGSWLVGILGAFWFIERLLSVFPA